MTTLAYLFLFIGLCVLGAAYQTQTGWLYLLGAASWGIVPLAWVCAWWDLRGATARTLPVLPASQGGPVAFTLAVERHRAGSSIGLQALLPDREPPGWFKFWRTNLVPSGWRNEALGPVSRASRSTARFELVAAKRGEFPLPTFHLQSAYPLGLVALTRPVETAGTFLVYPVGPRLLDVPWLAPAGQDAGHQQRFEAGTGAAPRGVREYRPGDPWRQIHWRTTARLGTPHVKETERERGEALVVYVDMRPEVHTPASVEHVVAIATSLLDYAQLQGRDVALVTQPEATPVASQGAGESQQLTWLARIDPAKGAGAPGGAEGAVLISPAYVPGWQRWAAHFIYCPVEAANPMDATVFCPVGADIPASLRQERQG